MLLPRCASMPSGWSGGWLIHTAFRPTVGQQRLQLRSHQGNEGGSPRLPSGRRWLPSGQALLSSQRPCRRGSSPRSWSRPEWQAPRHLMGVAPSSAAVFVAISTAIPTPQTAGQPWGRWPKWRTGWAATTWRSQITLPGSGLPTACLVNDCWSSGHRWRVSRRTTPALCCAGLRWTYSPAVHWTRATTCWRGPTWWLRASTLIFVLRPGP